MSKIIRITENAYDTLDKLAAETGSSKQLIIDKALENLARKHFFAKNKQSLSSTKE
jgi:predicted transcriptional regulator